MRLCVSLFAVLVSTLVLLGAGCGGAPPPAPVVAAAPPIPEPVVAEEGVIVRSELDRVLEEGLGRFLARVGVEAHMDGERFVGFRVTELRDGALFAGVDLQPGDTILRVNGQSIERPEHAFTVWTGLRVASELDVTVLRDGEARALRFAIID